MAINRKLVWSPKAREDFQAIIEYLLANWNEKTAQKFMDITFIAVDYTDCTFNIVQFRLRLIVLFSSSIGIYHCKIIKWFGPFYNYNWYYISRHPGHFPLINKKLKIRKCVLTRQNSLFYSVHRNEIALLRIFDTRQNPEKLKF